MAFTYDKVTLAASGSTGNVTGSTVKVGANYMTVGFLFVCEAAGATPTVTYKFQGSPNGTHWFDVAYITDASDTLAVTTDTITAVGAEMKFLANPTARKYRYYRVVTSSNTNVTFRAEAYLID